MKNNRVLNGYIVVYCPAHPKAMSSKVWNGYIYEHILVAEKMLGRFLKKGETVHHEDEVRSNNTESNIKVFKTKGDHNRYHKGSPAEKLQDGTYTCKKTSCICIDCGKETSKSSYNRCWECYLINNSEKIPSKEELQQLIFKIPTTHIAKQYGVSGKAVEKWCKKYGIQKPPRGYWMKHKKGS